MMGVLDAFDLRNFRGVVNLGFLVADTQPKQVFEGACCGAFLVNCWSFHQNEPEQEETITEMAGVLQSQCRRRPDRSEAQSTDEMMAGAEAGNFLFQPRDHLVRDETSKLLAAGVVPSRAVMLR